MWISGCSSEDCIAATHGLEVSSRFHSLASEAPRCSVVLYVLWDPETLDFDCGTEWVLLANTAMDARQLTGAHEANDSGEHAGSLAADLRKILDSLEAVPILRKSHLRSVLPMRRQTPNVPHEPEATLLKLAPFFQRAATNPASRIADVEECAAILREHAANCLELRAMALRAVAERLLRLHEPSSTARSGTSSIDTVLATPPSSYLYVKDVVRIGSYQAAGLFSNSPVAVARKHKQQG